MVWIFILGLLLLVLAIILTSNIKIELRAEVKSIQDKLEIDVNYKTFFKEVNQHYLIDLDLILSFISAPTNKPIDRKNSKSSHFLNKIRYTRESINTFLNYTKYYKIDNLNWVTTMGFEEADKTGFYSGSLWAFKGIVLSYLSKRAKLNEFHINVNPDFTTSIISSQFNCILRIRLVHIIRISISVLLSKVRGYFNGLTTTATTEPSH